MNARERLDQIRGRMPDLVVGGALCLDFANTVEPRGGLTSPTQQEREQANWRDYLRDYDDLVLWGLLVDAFGDETASALLRRSEHDPERAAALFARAIALREAIYRAFWRIAHGDDPAPADLAVIEAEYRDALAVARLQANGGDYHWTWPDETTLDHPLHLIAASAVDLLLHGDRERIKSCPGVEGSPMACAWLFYDTSKNRGRHWCSMEDCGGVTKARRLTERRRQRRRAAG